MSEEELLEGFSLRGGGEPAAFRPNFQPARLLYRDPSVDEAALRREDDPSAGLEGPWPYPWMGVAAEWALSGMGPSRESWVLIWLLRLAASDCAGAMVLQELAEDIEAMEISDGRTLSSDGTGLTDSSLTWHRCAPSSQGSLTCAGSTGYAMEGAG